MVQTITNAFGMFKKEGIGAPILLQKPISLKGAD
jgi:hypothetical protein